MMVEGVGIIENMKDDEELEMLLGEIPHATSLTHHHHHHHHPSHANTHHHHNGDNHGYGAMSSQSMNMNNMGRVMYGVYDDGPSCSYKQNACVSSAAAAAANGHAPFSSLFSNGHSPNPSDPSRNPHSKLPDSGLGRKVDGGLVGELDLSCDLSRMYITNDQDQGLGRENGIGLAGIGPSDWFPRPFSDRSSVGSMRFKVGPGPFGYPGMLTRAPRAAPAENLLARSARLSHPMGISAVSNGLYCQRQYGMSLMEERGMGVNVQPHMHNVPHLYHPNMSNGPGPGPARGGLESSEESLIIQGEDLDHMRNRGFGSVRGQARKYPQLEPTSGCENGRARGNWSFPSPVRCTSLAEASGKIFSMAKDQNGCRFLQRVFDDGSPQAVQTVFDEVIGDIVELMVNPFGNYLVQKLLEVCNEEQRMCILEVVASESRELIDISLNTHGTRVVQKLIETLKTPQQVRLVVAALEPGFLALIKDLNGNHVIQRCLQCLSSDDNKFIFEAAAKFCVDIATHQHGCCVLQRCISHATGEHRERLVAEISANGLLLAQDAFGNYVVQYILELLIPSAVSKLMAQFKGNYVHLATQKFSSHVVEKCLAALDGPVRSTIVRELLAAPHFEQLLQDPHANYVVQTALRVAEGPLHNSLVNAIESHKAVSRNSPYSKRIFSHKLLKR